MNYFFQIILFFLFLNYCTPKSNENEKKNVVARVQNNSLYEEDILKVIPENISSHDSTLFVNKFIDNWVKEELILNKAKMNLNKEQQNFSEQLKTYKNSLIKYEYEKYLIQQYLDTVVSKDDIGDYYEENKNVFRLSENIVDARYILLSVDSLFSDEARKKIKANNEDDFLELEEFCKKHTSDFSIEVNWIPFKLLLENTPLEVKNQKYFLKMNKNVFLKDSLYQYIIYISDYKLKNEISPLCFEKNIIKNLILNKRKLKIVEDMKKEVFKQARISNEFEIY